MPQFANVPLQAVLVTLALSALSSPAVARTQQAGSSRDNAAQSSEEAKVGSRGNRSMNAADALEVISEDTHNPLERLDQVGATKKRKLNLKGMSFWEAIARLEKKLKVEPAELRAHWTPQNPASEVLFPKSRAIYTHVDGATRASIHGDKDRQNAFVIFEIEPRLHDVAITGLKSRYGHVWKREKRVEIRFSSKHIRKFKTVFYIPLVPTDRVLDSLELEVTLDHFKGWTRKNVGVLSDLLGTKIQKGEVEVTPTLLECRQVDGQWLVDLSITSKPSTVIQGADFEVLEKGNGEVVERREVDGNPLRIYLAPFSSKPDLSQFEVKLRYPTQAERLPLRKLIYPPPKPAEKRR